MNSDGVRLTDETLGAYNRTLQEQVTELEYALAELPYSCEALCGPVGALLSE